MRSAGGKIRGGQKPGEKNVADIAVWTVEKYGGCLGRDNIPQFALLSSN